MKKKIKVGILFGGKSAEHEISLISAGNVIKALDTKKYQALLIKIPRTGSWPSSSDLLKLSRVDVVFPILHGPLGEDGTVQGLLKLADLPFVGAGVLGSAIGMDKDVLKRLLRDAHIPIPKFLVFKDSEKTNISFAKVAKVLKTPFFVKPVNMGSSVGISKVHNAKEFSQAINHAFKFDSKIIIEENIIGREIECSVLGNEKPIASLPGEIIPTHEFYSYEAKYLDEKGAILKVPADLPKKLVSEIQKLSTHVFKTLECEGMARVDMFVTKKGKIIINELNTIPGFTKISMYPKLWAASGISYSALIDKLIQLAIERHRKETKLKTKR